MPKHLLKKNQISLFFLLSDLEDMDPTNITTSGGGLSAIFTEDVKYALLQDDIPAAVWRPLGQGEGSTASIDLVEPVRELLSGTRSELLSQFHLNPTVGQILRFGDLPSTDGQALEKKTLCLEFGKTARARLSNIGISPRPLSIEFGDIMLFRFGTGGAFVLVTLSLSRLRDLKAIRDDHRSAIYMAELQEAVHALSRFNTCRWYLRGQNQPIKDQSFSLGQLVHSLVREKAPATTAYTRVPSHAYG